MHTFEAEAVPWTGGENPSFWDGCGAEPAAGASWNGVPGVAAASKCSLTGWIGEGRSQEPAWCCVAAPPGVRKPSAAPVAPEGATECGVRPGVF